MGFCETRGTQKRVLCFDYLFSSLELCCHFLLLVSVLLFVLLLPFTFWKNTDYHNMKHMSNDYIFPLFNFHFHYMSTLTILTWENVFEIPLNSYLNDVKFFKCYYFHLVISVWPNAFTEKSFLLSVISVVPEHK